MDEEQLNYYREHDDYMSESDKYEYEHTNRMNSEVNISHYQQVSSTYFLDVTKRQLIFLINMAYFLISLCDWKFSSWKTTESQFHDSPRQTAMTQALIELTQARFQALIKSYSYIKNQTKLKGKMNACFICPAWLLLGKYRSPLSF